MKCKDFLRRIRFTFLLFVIILKVTAQNVDVSSAIPPSPNAVSLGKFGDIPVGDYTGIPAVGVPLYTMHVGSFSLPIGLTYQSSGLKVEEIASFVGLGWALNAGGVITRSIHGLPDENANGYFQCAHWTVDSIAADSSRTMAFCNGQYDKQPDVFYFNFAGQAGKFILDSTTQHNAKFIPFSNLKLTHDAGLTSFQITDANGIRYIFNTRETTKKDSLSFVSSWYLTTIITPYGNINFTYVVEQTNQTLITEVDFLNGNCSGTPPGPKINISRDTIDARVLSQITSPYETVTFSLAPGRKDMPAANSVTGLIVTDPNNNKVKRFSFGQSYFGNTASSTPTDVRLKLDRVDEVSVLDSTQMKSYLFQYNSPATVPSVLSFAKDYWGFYNGETGNTSGLPYVDSAFNSTTLAEQATLYGHRESNASTAQVGVLQSIQYPTGGSSTFIYEGNDYSNLNAGQAVPHTSWYTWNAGTYLAQGQTSDADTVHYTIQQNYTMTTLSVSGHYTGPVPVGDGPTVVFNQINANGSRTLLKSYAVLNSTNSVKLNLNAGNYELIASVDGTGQSASASVNYSQADSVYLPKILPTGGLRIRQIVNTDSVGANPHIRTFGYRQHYDTTISSGALISDILIMAQVPTYAGCSLDVRTSSPLDYLGSTQGSHIGYAVVTESESVGGSTNGRKELYYTNPVSNPNVLGTEYTIKSRGNAAYYHNSFAYRTDYDMYRGILQKELTYNASGVLLRSSVNNFNFNAANYTSSPNDYTATGLAGSYNYLCYSGCTGCTGTIGPVAGCDNYKLYNFVADSYQILCPWIYPTNVINTVYDQNGQNPLTDTTFVYYDNPAHGLITRISQRNSKGDSLTTVNIYPGDKAKISGLDPTAGSVLDTMVARNIIAPIVQEEHYKNNSLVTRKRMDYAIWSGPLSNVAPGKAWYQQGLNPIENRNTFVAYDNSNHLLQVSGADGVNTSYVWDYGAAYAVAEIRNADLASVAYTSFETTGTGNWTVTGSNSQTTGGITGNSSITLSAGSSISKSGLNAARTYIISYWSTNGALSISGTTAITGASKNGWTYYQHSLPAGSTAVTITGSGINLDELRLFPTDAQMTTYTYNPLVGMSSVCSPNNLVAYYEYDGFARLLRVRDMDKNILKQYDYQYKVSGIYYNVARSASFTRNNCVAGGSPSTLTYTVNAGTYSSTISQSDADAKAQNDINANGQNYVNASGTCTFYNVVKSGTYTRNNCAAGGTPSSLTYTVNAGAYSSTISQADADSKAQNDVNANGQNYANANGTCTFWNAVQNGTFSRNNCGTGGVGSSITYSIPAGTYSSLISQADADQQAINALNTQGQNNANNNGSCTYYNTLQSGNFTRNNCSCQYTGSTVTYSVAAGTYSSSLNLTAANQLAINDVNANGQNYANSNGTCTTSCTGSSHKIINCSCATGTYGVISETQTGTGANTKCTIKWGYSFSDGTYVVTSTTTSGGVCP